MSEPNNIQPPTLIRDARPEDMEAVTEIVAWYVANEHVAMIHDTPTLTNWLARLAEIRFKNRVFLVFEHEETGEVMGFMTLAPMFPVLVPRGYDNTVQFSAFFRPEYRHLGVWDQLKAFGFTRVPELLKSGITGLIAGTVSDVVKRKASRYTDAGILNSHFKLMNIVNAKGKFYDVAFVHFKFPSFDPKM
jgi:hypothetical protein